MDEVEKFFENAELEISKDQLKLSKAEMSAKLDLLNYTSNIVKSSQQTDEIEMTLESALLERLQDPDILNEIPTGTLMKGLLELKRLRIEQQTGILSVFNQKGFVINQNFNNGEKNKSEQKEVKVKKEEEVTKEQFESAKKIYDLIQNIKDVEVEN